MANQHGAEDELWDCIKGKYKMSNISESCSCAGSLDLKLVPFKSCDQEADPNCILFICLVCKPFTLQLTYISVPVCL